MHDRLLFVTLIFLYDGPFLIVIRYTPSGGACRSLSRNLDHLARN